MALTMLGIKSNNRDGFTKIKLTDHNINQGIGFSYLGTSAEVNREFLNGKIKEQPIKASTARGLLEFEYNFTSGELFIGLMPTGSWALGLGVGASMKTGFQKNRFIYGNLFFHKRLEFPYVRRKNVFCTDAHISIYCVRANC